MIEGAARLRLAAAPAWPALAFFPSLFSFLPALPEKPAPRIAALFCQGRFFEAFSLSERPAGLDPFSAPRRLVRSGRAHWPIGDGRDRLGRALISGFFFFCLVALRFSVSFLPPSRLPSHPSFFSQRRPTSPGLRPKIAASPRRRLGRLGLARACVWGAAQVRVLLPLASACAVLVGRAADWQALRGRCAEEFDISLFDNGKNEGETAAPLRPSSPKAACDCWYNAAQRDRPRGSLGARESRINARRRKKTSTPFLPQRGPRGETSAGRARIFPLAVAKGKAPAAKNRFEQFLMQFLRRPFAGRPSVAAALLVDSAFLSRLCVIFARRFWRRAPFHVI